MIAMDMRSVVTHYAPVSSRYIIGLGVICASYRDRLSTVGEFLFDLRKTRGQAQPGGALEQGGADLRTPGGNEQRSGSKQLGQVAEAKQFSYPRGQIDQFQLAVPFF
jgi:hypothetical protein